MTSTSVPTEAEYIDSFPNPNLQKIEGIPTYETLKKLRSELSENAATIPSTRGGGAHGYLGVVLPDPIYTVVSGGVNFVLPNNPGLQPQIPVNATAAQIAERQRQHAISLREWKEYQAVHKALRKQLLEAVEPIYLRALRDGHVGFANVTVQEILQHLFAAYGIITPTELQANDARMKTAWDPSTPFETVIDQVEEAATFAINGHQPYTAEQILNTAYNLVYASGEYFEACEKWDDRPAAEKTWLNFKSHFLEAAHKLALRRQTAQGHGFHHANHLATSEPTMDLLANLAQAQVADRDTQLTLNATIATLSTQLQNQTALITQLQTQLTAALAAKAPAPDKDKKPKKPKDHGSYCWTHGYHVAANHTSATCRAPIDGHQAAATRDNPMGGSTKGKPDA